MSYTKQLNRRGLINCAPYVTKQLQYEVIMGSFAYGCSSNMSDTDIYGFCIPPKDVVFPHTNPKYIHGFDPVPHNFEQFQTEESIIDITYEPHRKYDVAIYNIVKYFRLCADGNPNMIDSLFVPYRCITHMSPIGELVRENRRLFLSKKCWHTFKGYAYAQLHKMAIKKIPTGKRAKSIRKYGYDVKFAYHLVRLLDEIQQILSTGDLDIERNREQLKAIRRGEWSEKKVIEYFEWKEKGLEELANDSNAVPYSPPRDAIRDLLFKCLGMHWQTLDGCRAKENVSRKLYYAIMDTLNQFETKI
jgi:predicted nucleotidyltransferase